MKFHTTLGLRQTRCVIFIFISMNTTAVLNADCETLVRHGGWSCSKVKGQPLADHVPSAGGHWLGLTILVVLPATSPQAVLLTFYSCSDADLVGWSTHQCPALSSRY